MDPPGQTFPESGAMRLGRRLPLFTSIAMVALCIAASPVAAVSVLLVTNNNGSLTAEETAIRDQLVAWGHTVNTVWDNAAQATYDAAFASNNVVYVPRGVSASQVGYKLRQTTLGVISENQGLTDEMGFSTSGGGTSSSSDLTIINDTHTVTNPFSVGTLGVGSSSISLSRMGGTTASGATVLGRVGSNDALVAVETGATLATAYSGSSVAFGRRIHSPIALGSSYASLTSDGWTLVERALAWALGLNETLVAHWKLDETSGSSAADASGYSHTGTVFGVSAWTAAVLDNGFSFDGATRIQATGLLDQPGSISVAAWANLTQADSGGAEIVSLGDRFRLRLDAGGVTKAAFYNGSTFVEVAVGQTFAGGGWHHFAATFDDAANAFKLYVDGVEVASTTTTASISYSGGGSNTIIGRHGNGGSAHDFTGAIDDVRVYNYAISAKGVAKLYGLVGHWQLAESSGTTAADSTVFAADGALSGPANWTTDCGGNPVFDFDGTNYFSVSNAAQLQPTERLSIAAWIYGRSWGSGSDVDAILRKGEGNPNDYQLSVANNGHVELTLDGNDNNGVQSASTLSTGRWYHVVGTWDGETAKIYVDGALDHSEARSGTIGMDTRPLYLGGRSGADFFDGLVRDVRLYNRALLDAEIRQLAGAGGHWKFDEGSGSTAADSSGAGNDATLAGGASWTADCSGNYALLTDGSGGIAQTNAKFTPPDVGTVVFWMRPSGTPVGSASLFGVSGDWEVRQISDGTLVFDLGGEGGGNFATTTPLDEAGRWYHVAATFDASDDSYAVYLDGVLHKSGTNSNAMSPQSAGVLSFGTRTGSTEYWAGALRDVRVYRRKLCAVDIARIYGLLGHWKLDETTGTTAYDASGHANHGTYTNGVTLAGAAGPFGGTVAATFDGNNDYVSIGTESSYDLTGPMTVAVWIKVSSFTKNSQSIFMKGNNSWRLIRRGNTNAIQFACNGLSPNQVNGTQNVNDGQWHHVAGVFDGDSLDLYIDGVLDASASTSGSISTNNHEVQIGRSSQGTSREFHGAIYDARIYRRALCQSEIADLVHGGGDEGVRIIKWVEVQ